MAARLIDEEEDRAREATPEEVEDIERNLKEDRGSDLAGPWYVTPWGVEEEARGEKGDKV